MQQTQQKQQKTYPDEVREVLERASAGDQAVLPELKRVLTHYPEIAAVLGDLTRHAEMALLRLFAGADLAAREAVATQLASLRERLHAEAGSEMERMLADRVSLDWLALAAAELDLTGQLNHAPNVPSARLAQQRLDRAHARFLASGKSLALVGKLLRRSPSPLELLRPRAEGAVKKAAGPGPRPEVAAAMGVG